MVIIKEVEGFWYSFIDEESEIGWCFEFSLDVKFYGCSVVFIVELKDYM